MIMFRVNGRLGFVTQAGVIGAGQSDGDTLDSFTAIVSSLPRADWVGVLVQEMIIPDDQPIRPISLNPYPYNKISKITQTGTHVHIDFTGENS